jgi:Domain of unknown function (DUF1840)
MLIPFRSKAAGDFFMFDHHVRPLFDLMGKPFSAQGVINGASAGAFATALSAALEAAPAEKAVNDADINADINADTSSGSNSELPVGLKQRAWPLLDMLRRAASKNVDVVWGSAV